MKTEEIVEKINEAMDELQKMQDENKVTNYDEELMIGRHVIRFEVKSPWRGAVRTRVLLDGDKLHEITDNTIVMPRDRRSIAIGLVTMIKRAADTLAHQFIEASSQALEAARKIGE